MKKIKILLQNQGGSVSDEFWNQLLQIDNGELHETESSYLIILTSGKRIYVDKTRVFENDEIRIIHWGSMNEIGGTDFLFSRMKGLGDGMFEILHGYFGFNIGPLAGFHLIISTE